MFVSILLALVLTFSSDDAQYAYDRTAELVRAFPQRESGTVGARGAAGFLAAQATSLGAEVQREVFHARTIDGILPFTNVLATFKVSDALPWIILLSHYDTKSGVASPGATDGASTSGLLLALARFLSRPEASAQAQANFLLLWTDGEECRRAYGPEDGLHGARQAANSLRRQGLQVKAVVVLDLLGNRDLRVVIPANGDAVLRAAMLAAARVARLPEGMVRADPSLVMVDDHVPFLEAGFPAIDLIDYGTAEELNQFKPWWHTPADTMDKVSKVSLENAGRLVVAFLARMGFLVAQEKKGKR